VNEALARDLLVEGRTVWVKAGDFTGKVGFIQEIESIFDRYLVSDGKTLSAHPWFEIEPMFTLDQVVDVKIADQAEGSDLFEKLKPFGLSSEDLGDYVAEFMSDCVGRIKGVGDKQYSEDGGYQRFEAMDLDDLFEYIEEEIRDIPNYCTMLFIRIRRLREALKVADVIPEEDEEIPDE